MSILDCFASEMIAAERERTTTTNINGIPTSGDTDTLVFECNYWEGSAAERLVNERFRDTTSAVIGIYPDLDIVQHDIIHANGEKYKAMKPQNIAGLDELVIVPLEIFK